MPRKALEKEHLSPDGGSVREPGGRALIMRALERYVMEGFGKPQALSKIGLDQYVYRARVPASNRLQSRVVSGLLTGHNTLRRHPYTMGLINSPSCRRCGVEEET
jgi:hypothetical protein